MYEFAVVGTGMLGAPAGRHLAQLGKSTLMIGAPEPSDYKNHRGVYASHYDEGRISRIIDPDPIRCELSRVSVAAHKTLQQSTGVDFFAEVGHLAVGATDGSGYIEALMQADRQFQEGCTWLGSGEIERRYPYFQPGENCQALLQEKLAGYLNPRSYIAAECTAFKSLGGEAVAGLVLELRERKGVVEIVTESATYRAEKVLLATGAFSRFGRLLPGEIKLNVGSHTVLLAEINPDQLNEFQNMPGIIYKPLDSRRNCFILPPINYPDGRTYLKIAKAEPRDYFDTVADAQSWFKTDGDAHEREKLADLLAELCPSLRPLSQRSIPCVTSYTPLGHPYIDHVSRRIVALIGGNGYVAKCSIALGEMAARYAIDGSWIHDGIDRNLFKLST